MGFIKGDTRSLDSSSYSIPQSLLCRPITDRYSGASPVLFEGFASGLSVQVAELTKRRTLAQVGF